MAIRREEFWVTDAGTRHVKKEEAVAVQRKWVIKAALQKHPLDWGTASVEEKAEWIYNHIVRTA